MTTNNEIEKAVKIVAEFMRQSKVDNLNYSTSLDALAPVWEKMDHLPPKFERWKREDKWVAYYGYDSESTLGVGKTIQQAALLATAKAIESLRNERTENTGGMK